MSEGVERMETTSGAAANLADATLVRNKMRVTVSGIKREAGRIISIELRDVGGLDLPAFSAGAHIELHLDGGMVRSYSLCSNPGDRKVYRIAVLREENGRGGSIAMHKLREGQVVTITAPRNHFPLAGKEAKSHLLLAGGIGVTPMLAMIAELEARSAPWTMHYCARSQDDAAFLDELQGYVAAGKVQLHFDGGDPSKGLDIKALLADAVVGTHVYYCGPPGFMTACKNSVGAWAPHTIHCEYFAASAEGKAEHIDAAFQVKIKSSGKIVDVPVGSTLVEVLRENGCSIDTDCEDGYCGTCITRFLSGSPDHRDTVLSEGERKNYIMVCCSRAKGGILELDI